jgi:hypothetical protein
VAEAGFAGGWFEAEQLAEFVEVDFLGGVVEEEDPEGTAEGCGVRVRCHGCLTPV